MLHTEPWEPWHRSLSRASIAPLVWWSNQKRPCRNSTFQRAVRRMVVCVRFFLGGMIYNILTSVHQNCSLGDSSIIPPSTISRPLWAAMAIPGPLWIQRGTRSHGGGTSWCWHSRLRLGIATTATPWATVRDSLGQLPGHLPGPSDRNPGENRHLPVVCSTPHPSWAIKIMTQWHVTDYTSYKVDLATWSVDLSAALSTQPTPKLSQSELLDHTKSEALDHTTNTYLWVNERSCCAHLHLSPIFCYNTIQEIMLK